MWPPLSGPCRLRKIATRFFPVPELVRYATTQSRLDATQEHRNHVAASWREAPSFPQITTARPPAPGILRYWQTCSLPGHPVYLISMLHDYRARKRCFLARLAELRRLKLISNRLPNPLETFMIRDCHFMRHVANFCAANEFRPETKTRTLPAINAKPESEKRQSVCRRSAKKPDPPHGQKTYRLAQTKPTVSTQSGGGPSTILFPCHFRLAPKLGRRSPIAKFTYCRHSRKILARPSHRRGPKKLNQLR